MELATTRSMHPLTAIAAISVTLFSLTGIAALTGLIPTSHGQTQVQPAKPAEEPAKTAAAAQTPIPAAPAIDPRIAEKIAAHRAASRSAKPVAQAAKPLDEPVKTTRDNAPMNIAQSDPMPAMAPPPPMMAPPPPPAAAPPKPLCHDCGVIESVREFEKKGAGSPLGAIAGGVAGGLLGSQTGQGRGKSVMTLLGTIGGAFAGHEIEKNVNKVKGYEIAIRFDDGSSRLITQDNPPAWHQGDRVKFVNGIISASHS